MQDSVGCEVEQYLPKRARVYKAKGGAQDAHEAIRPVDVNITPDEVKLKDPVIYDLLKPPMLNV